MSRALHCPSCDYDLQSQAALTDTPTCPECGARVLIGLPSSQLESPTLNAVAGMTLMTSLLGLALFAGIVIIAESLIAGGVVIPLVLALNAILLLRRDRRLLGPALVSPLVPLLFVTSVGLFPFSFCLAFMGTAWWGLFMIASAVAFLIAWALSRWISARCRFLDHGFATRARA